MNQQKDYESKLDTIQQKIELTKKAFEDFLDFFKSEHIVFFNKRSETPANEATVQFKDGVLYIPHDQLEQQHRRIIEEDLFWIAHELSHAITATNKQLFSPKNFGFTQTKVFQQYDAIIKNESKTFALQFHICKHFLPNLDFDLFFKKESIILKNTFIDAYCDSEIDHENDTFNDPFIFADHVADILKAKIQEQLPKFENINLLDLKNNLINRLKSYEL